jgi:HAMP domain-containing protein
MIRTIKQRIYVVGLLPLATLAMALVLLNGVARIDEASQELGIARKVTAALLQGPAIDALVVGNVLNFEQSVRSVISTSPSLVCVTLRDDHRRMVSQIGRCNGQYPVTYFPITASSEGFSDFKESRSVGAAIGELGVAMDEGNVARKRRQVILQLALSLVMVAMVLILVARLLRARLIEPIRRIGNAMQAVGLHNYSTHVQVEGEDELSRLGEAINQTIGTIAAYTRELERRRNDADRALHDADEANMVRGGLVRALTEDLDGPLGLMHGELTAIAVANKDPALRDPIRAVIALLQKAQMDFADLIEISASTQGVKRPLARDVEDILADIERDVRLLTEAERISITVAPTVLPAGRSRRGEPTGILLDVDAVRLKKAITYLIRALGRRCKDSGVYVNAEFIPVSTEQMHVSVHLKSFYDSNLESELEPLHDRLDRYRSIAAFVGWTDREIKVIDYLLSVAGIEPTISATSMGAVSVLLGTTCQYVAAEDTARQTSPDWTFATRPISTVVVSNDPSLMRLATRGDITNLEIKLMSFSRAMMDPSLLRAEGVLLMDMSDDIAEVIRLLDQIKDDGAALPPLVAICPPGRISDSLSERLLELGFKGVIQKPVHYSRLIEVIRATLADPLQTSGLGKRMDHPGET